MIKSVLLVVLLMKKTIFILLFVSLCLVPSRSLAQVLIEQGKMELTAVPGETLAGSLDVHNTSDEPVAVRIYLADFIYVEPFNGKKDFLPAGSTEYSMANWFSFFPGELTLQPYESAEIKYSMKVPADALGGYYNVLFVEQDAGRVGTGAMAGVKIVSRVGALFFVETVNTRPQAEIMAIEAAGSNLQVRIQNTGQTILIPSSVYFIIDQKGRAVQRGEADLLYLPPKKTGTILIPFGEGLEEGTYTLVLTIDLGEGKALVREINIQMTPDGGRKILEVRE